MDNTFPSKLSIIYIIAILAGGLILFSKELLLAAILLYGFGVVYFYVFRDFDFCQRNLIILLGGYFILTRGFSYIGFRIGHFYIFIGEIVMFLTLIFHNFKPAIVKLLKNPISKWLIVWISLGFILAISNIPKYWLVSVARDYAIVYYSIFILFGYAFYKNYKNLEIFYKILGWVFILHTIWGLFYPFRTTIAASSPKLMGIMPLFSFRGDADSVIFMGGVLYFLLLAKQYKWSKLLGLLLVIIQFFLLLIFTVRAAYVGSLFVFLLLTIINKKRILLKSLVTITLLFSLFTVFNLQLPAEKSGTPISSATVIDRFCSIFKPRQSGTASFRLLWWKTIINDSLQSPKLLFFGRGFGPSLAFASYLEVGDVTRKDEEIAGLAKSPHSILMTIFGRMGILGLFLWLGIHYTFFSYMLKGIKISKNNAHYEIHSILVWIVGFVLMIIGTSMFGVLLEGPFTAIPYFFFMGLGIAIVDKLVLKNNPNNS